MTWILVLAVTFAEGKLLYEPLSEHKSLAACKKALKQSAPKYSNDPAIKLQCLQNSN